MYLRPGGTLVGVGLSSGSDVLSVPISVLVGKVRVAYPTLKPRAYFEYGRTLQSEAVLLGNRYLLMISLRPY